MTRSKYHPVPTCDDGDLCNNPATVRIKVQGITPQGNPTHHLLCLCEQCAALLLGNEAQPVQSSQPAPYRTRARGSRFV